MLDGRALGAFLERRVDPCRMQREVLADLAVVDRDARVLADEVLLVLGHGDVAEDRLQDALAGHRGLASRSIGERVAQVLRDVLQCPDVEMRRGVCDGSVEIGCERRHERDLIAAALPARRPNTAHSSSELPIMRFLPWVPPAISPQAKTPSRVVSACSSITSPPFW